MQLDLPRRKRRVLGLTPLIDIVFLLVVFFMLASTFLEYRSITLSTPAANTAAGGIEGAVLVRIDGAGEVDLNGVAIPLTALEDRMRGLLADDPARRVVVRPHEAVSLQNIVAVLDRLAAAGAANLTLHR